MPDITMCTGQGCPSRNSCYNPRAIPKEQWQSWFAAPPIADGDCRHFEQIRLGDRTRDPEPEIPA